MTGRKQQIEAMLKDEPQDVFLRYTLAMELRKEGDVDGSLQWFSQLIAERPPHVPSFFMAAQLLSDHDRTEEARGLLRDGIEAARRQDDSHAAAEMAELLASLGERG